MSIESLPPDVQAARKVRINSDIIKLCSKPVPPGFHPSVQGVGLYTHVADIKTAGPLNDAEQGKEGVSLLPLGGPKRLAPSKFQEPPNKDLAALYKQLQEAVTAEEQLSASNTHNPSLDLLNKKYGSISDNSLIPDTEPQDTRRHSEATSTEASKRRKVSLATLTELRRKSADSTTGGRMIDSERRGSGSKSGNDYDVYRDPRRRRR